jgi:transposase
MPVIRAYLLIPWRALRVRVNRAQRAAFLRSLVGRVRRQEIPYEPRPPRARDWSAYDKAQVHEVREMLLLIRDAVDAAWRRLEPALGETGPNPGLPAVPVPDLAKAVLAQQYFGVSNREAEGYVLLFQEVLGLTRAFSYKSVERAYGDPDVRRVLRELFALTQLSVQDLETTQAVDGTGMPTSQKVNYEAAGRKGRKAGFEKVLTSIGTTYGLYASVVPMESPEDNESPYFPRVVQDLSGYPNLEFVVGDSAFLSRGNCTLVASLGAEPRFFPKAHTTFKRFGSDAHVRMLWRFVEDLQGWLREYHPRSLAESGFSALKRRDPRPLRRRLKDRKALEVEARFFAANLRRLHYLRYLRGIWMDYRRLPVG